MLYVPPIRSETIQRPVRWFIYHLLNWFTPLSAIDYLLWEFISETIPGPNLVSFVNTLLLTGPWSTHWYLGHRQVHIQLISYDKYYKILCQSFNLYPDWNQLKYKYMIYRWWFYIEYHIRCILPVSFVLSTGGEVPAFPPGSRRCWQWIWLRANKAAPIFTWSRNTIGQSAANTGNLCKYIQPEDFRPNVNTTVMCLV